MLFTYPQGEISTIAQMYSFEAAMARRVMLAVNDVTLRVPARPQTHVSFGERIHTLVGDVGALDEPDSLEFG